MGVVNLVVLVCVLRATTKKGSSTFREKSAPARENPFYAYG